MQSGREGRHAGRDRAPDASSDPADAPVPPSVDDRWFRHELTPTWLATASLLAGVEPVDVALPFRVAWLGCGARFTPAVVAAVHPASEVVAWDPDPSKLAAVRQLAIRAGLANLTVHERPEPPTEAQGPFDIIVIDGLLDSVDDRVRAALVDASATLLRPGGIAAVTYRTVVGWGEIAPVVHLIRHLALTSPRAHVDSVASAKVLLERLRELGARYLLERPVVREWLRETLELSSAEIVEQYVHRPLRPISHAQVVEAFATIGISFVGDARMAIDPPDGVPEELARQVDRAASPLLRQALADLAIRRTDRVDLFCLGPVREPSRVRSRKIQNLRLLALAPSDSSEPTADVVVDGAVTEIWEHVATTKQLWSDAKPAQREHELRRLLSTGLAHPVQPAEPSPEVHEAADRLSPLMNASAVPAVHRHTVAPAAATAVASTGVTSPERRRALGIDRP